MSLTHDLHSDVDPMSMLYNFQHRPVVASSRNTKPIMENTLLAIAAGGPVLFLLIFPSIVWLKTRSLDAITKIFSTMTLLTGVANSIVWMFYSSFVLRTDDCMELIVSYPMVFTISIIYLVLIWGHKTSYFKAIGLLILAMPCVGYLFYLIRFEETASKAQDFVGFVGSTTTLALNIWILHDITNLAGGWYILIGFINALLNTLLNGMTGYVLIRKYPVPYYAIVNSSIGLFFGFAQIFFLFHRICRHEQNGPEDEVGGQGHPPHDPADGPHVPGLEPQDPAGPNDLAAVDNDAVDEPLALANHGAAPNNGLVALEAHNDEVHINIPNDHVNHADMDSSNGEPHEAVDEIVNTSQGITSFSTKEVCDREIVREVSAVNSPIILVEKKKDLSNAQDSLRSADIEDELEESGKEKDQTSKDPSKDGTGMTFIDSKGMAINMPNHQVNHADLDSSCGEPHEAVDEIFNTSQVTTSFCTEEVYDREIVTEVPIIPVETKKDLSNAQEIEENGKDKDNTSREQSKDGTRMAANDSKGMRPVSVKAILRRLASVEAKVRKYKVRKKHWKPPICCNAAG